MESHVFFSLQQNCDDQCSTTKITLSTYSLKTNLAFQTLKYCKDCVQRRCVRLSLDKEELHGVTIFSKIFLKITSNSK